MKKRILNVLFSKAMIVAYLIVLQLILLVATLSFLSSYSDEIKKIFQLLSVIMVIYILNKDDNPSYKLAWIILILIMPPLGGVLYLLFGGQKVAKELRVEHASSNEAINQIVRQNDDVMADLKREDQEVYKHARYLWYAAQSPIYRKTETYFLADGKAYYEALLEEIKHAEKYIFMEYFILDEGKMWNTILDAMLEKSRQGVDVRLMYDDAGCITKQLGEKYDEKLRALGIKCKAFNPIRARLAVRMNNRDHRKISVIDGKVAFTGGINLADEYMNEKEIYGHWRDQGVMIKGEAVYNFIVMFLRLWNFGEAKKSNPLDFKTETNNQNDGYVIPFSDTPTDGQCVGENMHINIINSANEYIYIQTPYLILDNETKNALQLAAKGGVDVRIMVPHIPDKKLVFQVTQANYAPLLKCGVRIYEYTPGFVHAKTIVSDDKCGIIGSINFDYRSYYMHFECGLWMYKSHALMNLKDDFIHTLPLCHEVTYQEYMKTNVLIRLVRSVLNMFSPLL